MNKAATKATASRARTMPVVNAVTHGVGSMILAMSMPKRGVGVAAARVGTGVGLVMPMTTGVATTMGVGVSAGVGEAAVVGVVVGVGVAELSTRTVTMTSS